MHRVDDRYSDWFTCEALGMLGLGGGLALAMPHCAGWGELAWWITLACAVGLAASFSVESRLRRRMLRVLESHAVRLRGEPVEAEATPDDEADLAHLDVYSTPARLERSSARMTWLAAVCGGAAALLQRVGTDPELTLGVAIALQFGAIGLIVGSRHRLIAWWETHWHPILAAYRHELTAEQRDELDHDIEAELTGTYGAAGV